MKEDNKIECELPDMASDSEVDKEINIINDEFSQTECDGLETGKKDE